MADQPQMLQGTRILSFTQFLLGPAGVQYLADMGADVVKVEPPGGKLFERNWSGCDLFLNGVSAFFLCAHRNQRSLTLDLKHPEGLAAAKRLVAAADVLVQNFRPGVMERLGLGYEEATRLNPRLVYVTASGYGSRGAYRDRPGQDLLIQAMSGLASISGQAGQPPTAVGAPVVDQHGAALLAMAVLAALLERVRTGRGRLVEVSMLRAALDLQQEAVTYFLNGGEMRKSPTSLGSMIHPGPYGIYQTRDGYLALSMSTLAVLAEALEVPALRPLAAGKDPYNYHAREEVARILEPVIRQRTTAEWVERLVPRGVWAAPVRRYEEVFADPAVRESGAVEEIRHPVAGPVRLLRFPVDFVGADIGCRRPAPMAGEHSRQILQEAGYTPGEIERLRAAGAI